MCGVLADVSTGLRSIDLYGVVFVLLGASLSEAPTASDAYVAD